MNIVRMSISSGVLILFIVVIRLLASQRLPKSSFIMLWGVALLRLLIPFSFPSRYSIFSLFNSISGILFFKSGIAEVNPTRFIYLSPLDFNFLYKPLWTKPPFLIWAAGFVILAYFFAITYYKWNSEMKTALPLKGNAIIDDWLSKQGMRRKIKVYISDLISTPLTCGIIRPKILLPKSLDLSNETQLNYIFTHELIHIRRFDSLWKLLLLPALCLHWFNPLVWILYIFMNRDLEISCDERVVRLFGEKIRSDYAMSILSFAENRAKFALPYSCFSKNTTKERIVSIMKFKKASYLSLALAVFLIVCSTVVFLGGSTKNVVWLYRHVNPEEGGINGTTVSGSIYVSVPDETILKELPAPPEGKTAFKIFTVDKQTETTNNASFKNSVQADNNGTLTIKDENGRVIGYGVTDLSGAAVIKDSNGVNIGTVNINNATIKTMITKNS